MSHTLTTELAAHYADIALGHIGREYPNKLDHVLDGPGDARTPRDLHPIFYGSFDWHSCVHSYWMLAILLLGFPDNKAAPAIAARFDEMFTAEKVAGELAYLDRPSSGGFERPYGWAWTLELAHALCDAKPAWSQTLQPLADAFARRFKAFLPKADYPVRTGVHTNTAFALRLALDYADAFGDDELATLIRERARLWYGADRDAPAWEPSGDDFLSPTLTEAQLMAVVLPQDAFSSWLAAFMPGLARGRPQGLLEPVRVSDRSDGKIAHLDGLNLSRAWAWRELARHLPSEASRIAFDAAERHLNASLPHVAGDYMGEHWLATYAVLAFGAFA